MISYIKVFLKKINPYISNHTLQLFIIILLGGSMEKILPYIKSISTTLITILISIFILSIVYYFHLTNDLINSILCIIIPIIIIFINSFKLGKKAHKLGFLEGLKLGIVIIVIFSIMNLIFKNNITIKILIYYLIIIVTSMFGSTLGINKKGEIEKPI